MALEAPPAPPAGVTIVQPSTPPKAPPAPTTTIKLGSSSQSGATQVEAPKPGSARARLSAALAAKAGVTPPATPAAPAQPPAAPAAAAPEAAEPATPPAEPPGDPGVDDPGQAPPAAPEGQTPPADPAAQPQGKTKVNPWKVVDQWKSKAAELEKQVADIQTTTQKKYLTQIEELQKRNAQLEEDMRFVNYESTEEFKEKYHAPYQKAFDRAVAEMSELVIEDPETKTQRNVSGHDIVALANMPLAEARKFADAVYGDFADDMMAHRKEIRNLYAARQEALNEAKTKGAEREKQKREMAAKQTQEIQEHIKTTWSKVNDEAVKNPTYGKFFSPVEGDQDGNQRLAKGYELVDRAFSENPNDPRLTPEQRDSIIKRHSAVRNRAAAAGRLISWLNQRDKQIAELKAELAKYQGTTPRTGGAPAAGTTGDPATTGKASDRIFAALRAKAR